MKKRTGMATLAVLLVTAFMTSQAFAETLGDKLARDVCWGLSTGGTYTLSSTDNSSWNGQLIQGSKEQKNGSQTVTAKFLKQSNNDAAATCELRTTYSGSTVACDFLPITKSGKTLTMGARQACGIAPLF